MKKIPHILFLITLLIPTVVFSESSVVVPSAQSTDSDDVDPFFSDLSRITEETTLDEQEQRFQDMVPAPVAQKDDASYAAFFKRYATIVAVKMLMFYGRCKKYLGEWAAYVASCL